MKPVLWGIQYVLRHRLCGARVPLICGLVLTNRCNLSCLHCRVTDRGGKDLSFEETCQAIDMFYREGGRCLYLEGGEPFLWRDQHRTIEDVVDYAHRVGFFAVIIYTNGTLPLETCADTVFVSLDGLPETHDRLRGASFAKVTDNIRASAHPSIFINFTINAVNRHEVADFCTFVDRIDQVRGTFFYFHTPYYGRDELYLEPAERATVIRQLLECKRRFRILNSRAGLRSALRNDWQRPLDICRVYESGETYRCCRYPDDPELCRDCGYLSYAEIDQTLRLKPTAILNALKYF